MHRWRINDGAMVDTRGIEEAVRGDGLMENEDRKKCVFRTEKLLCECLRLLHSS